MRQVILYLIQDTIAYCLGDPVKIIDYRSKNDPEIKLPKDQKRIVLIKGIWRRHQTRLFLLYIVILLKYALSKTVKTIKKNANGAFCGR